MRIKTRVTRRHVASRPRSCCYKATNSKQTTTLLAIKNTLIDPHLAEYRSVDAQSAPHAPPARSRAAGDLRARPDAIPSR